MNRQKEKLRKQHESMAKTPDPRSRPNHKVLAMPCLFWFHPTGHRKTKVIFLVEWLDQITPVAPGKTDRQAGHSGPGNKQEGDYCKIPGLISSREPSQNPQPSGTVKCPFLSREHLPYHIRDMKINYPSTLASTDKEALHAFIYSQILHRICHVYICWTAKWGKDMCLLWLGLEWWVQFETLCKTNACGTPSGDTHQRGAEADTSGRQAWGSDQKYRLWTLNLRRHLRCLHVSERSWGRSERPKSFKKRRKILGKRG